MQVIIPEEKTVLQKLRGFLWPIYGKEHKEFLPMTIMISLILFDYTVFRNIKDTLVISATGGAEILTFLKVWVVLPLAFIFFFIFTKLSNVFSRQTIFYSTVLFFLAFFALFAYILYPNQDLLYPTASTAWLSENLPASMQNFIDMYRFWSLSLFYAMAELWGSVVATLLFWQLANSIIQVNKAKRFYAHFYLLANLATAGSGLVMKYVNSLGAEIIDKNLRYGLTLDYLTAIALISGILILFLYFYLDRYVVSDKDLVAASAGPSQAKKKLKLSMKQSLQFILHSKYLGLIAVLVISYGITINIAEVNWKNQVHIAFPERNDYNSYMGMVSFYTGMLTFLIILIGGWFIRILGWTISALATPVMIGLTGMLFFYFLIFNSSAEPLAASIGTQVALLSVSIGTIQNVLSKSTKYALFDPTKEMSYIPLDDESKAKGKAAVDVVGGRFGKAGGALIQEFLFIFVGPIAMVVPHAAGIMLFFVVIWIFAAMKLGTLFEAKRRAQQPD